MSTTARPHGRRLAEIGGHAARTPTSGPRRAATALTAGCVAALAFASLLSPLDKAAAQVDGATATTIVPAGGDTTGPASTAPVVPATTTTVATTVATAVPEPPASTTPATPATTVAASTGPATAAPVPTAVRTASVNPASVPAPSVAGSPAAAALPTAPRPTVAGTAPSVVGAPNLPGPTAPGALPTTPPGGSPATIGVPGAPPTTQPVLPVTVPAVDVGPVLTFTGNLSVGSRGDEVLALEQRLDALRYHVGKVDGRYDWETWQGVVAFQKVNLMKRTGRVSADVRNAINAAVKPTGLIPNGGTARVEVDISRQVMFIYKRGGLWKVVAISSGSGRKYCEIGQNSGKRNCGDAQTPRGNFRIQRRINGWRQSDLGRLYNPLYFTGGFAIHGAPSVPAHPASHGCVRVTLATAQWLPAELANGTRIYIYD